jgi:hypothetical protein
MLRGGSSLLTFVHLAALYRLERRSAGPSGLSLRFGKWPLSENG